jgi:predicted transcriptional regulator
MKINHLTPSEELLMQILWKIEHAYMKDVIEHYPGTETASEYCFYIHENPGGKRIS